MSCVATRRPSALVSVTVNETTSSMNSGKRALSRATATTPICTTSSIATVSTRRRARLPRPSASTREVRSPWAMRPSTETTSSRMPSAISCEEIEVIAPAVRAACAEGIEATGPHAPDTVFMRARHAPGHPGEFDVVVAMYHDQGLIPVKYLGLDQGVNFTLGLPLVRTSPDHGTAFDLAGTGRADPSSFLEAVRAARALIS
mgnify:CR=1 FL=1